LTLPLLKYTEISCTVGGYQNLGARSQKRAPKHRHCER